MERTTFIEQRVGGLPALPRVAQKALELLRTPEATTGDLDEVMLLDQEFASTVLRMASSTQPRSC